MSSLLERISLNANELRLARVKNTVEMLAEASYTNIAKVKSELLAYINNIDRHLDLGATSTTDIATNLQNVNPQDWVSQLDESVLKVKDRVLSLNIRIAVHNELFPDKKIKPITYGDYDGIISTIIKMNSNSKYRRNRNKVTK